MKPTSLNLRRLIAISAFALLCFCVGYLAPHRLAVSAPSPHPTSTMDDVPGGGGTHGLAVVTNATVRVPAMLGATGAGWPCTKGDHCAVSFEYRVTPGGSAAPKPYNCSNNPNCFSYTGSDFQFQTEDPDSGAPIEVVSHVQIAGMIQLKVTK